MNELLAAEPTIRDRILEVFKKRYLAQQRGVNGAALTWDVVSRTALSNEDQLAGFALGIYGTSEKKSPQMGSMDCFMNVVLEFHSTLSEGDDPERWYEGVLGEVQRVAMLDLQMKDENGVALALNVIEKGNEPDILMENATKIAGVVVMEVKYRHKVGNPTKR